MVRQAVDKMADKLFKQFSRDAALTPDLPVPGRATLRALALVELVRLGTGGIAASYNPAQPDPEPDPDEPPAPGPAPASGPAGRSRGHVEITLVVPAGDPTTAHTSGGIRLADGTIRTLMCDAVLYPIVIDGLGVPIDMGREFRLATPSQRKMIALRDGGCVFPGCDANADRCDCHHLHEWDDGGPTDLCNLCNLCRRHHGITHRNDWEMTIDPTRGAPAGGGPPADVWFIWRTPSGQTLHSQRHGMAHRAN